MNIICKCQQRKHPRPCYNFHTSLVRLKRVGTESSDFDYAFRIFRDHTEIPGKLKEEKYSEPKREKKKQRNKHFAPLCDSFSFTLPVHHEFESKKITREYVRNNVQH